MVLYNIEHHKSSPYRPQANGAVEAVNKNVKNILAKMVLTYKDWAEKLLFALWDYRTSICASTRVTPYSLVYGSEVVLPIEVKIQSLRVLVETKVLVEDWAKARYEQLALIYEKRARVHYHARGYQGGLGILSLRRSCPEVLQGSKIWMGRRCFVQLTWIDSRNTTSKPKKGKA